MVLPLCRKTRFGWWVERSLSICCGFGLVVLAPWIPLSYYITVPVLLMLGVCIAKCHWIGTSFVTSMCLGPTLGAMLWQAFLCDLVDAWWHGWLLSASTLFITTVFTCTKAGPMLFLTLIMPCLASMLLTVGLAGFTVLPAGPFPPQQLFAPSPAQEEGVAAEFAALWLCLAVVAVAARVLAAWLWKEKLADGEQGGLVAALLPDGDDSLMPRPEDSENRHLIITKAIYAPEGADLSHLTEHEKKLVDICRRDEEERDRILFGGGLY